MPYLSLRHLALAFQFESTANSKSRASSSFLDIVSPFSVSILLLLHPLKVSLQSRCTSIGIETTATLPSNFLYHPFLLQDIY